MASFKWLSGAIAILCVLTFSGLTVALASRGKALESHRTTHDAREIHADSFVRHRTLSDSTPAEPLPEVPLISSTGNGGDGVSSGSGGNQSFSNNSSQAAVFSRLGWPSPPSPPALEFSPPSSSPPPPTSLTSLPSLPSVNNPLSGIWSFLTGSLHQGGPSPPSPPTVAFTPPVSSPASPPSLQSPCVNQPLSGIWSLFPPFLRIGGGNSCNGDSSSGVGGGEGVAGAAAAVTGRVGGEVGEVAELLTGRGGGEEEGLVGAATEAAGRFGGEVGEAAELLTGRGGGGVSSDGSVLNGIGFPYSGFSGHNASSKASQASRASRAIRPSRHPACLPVGIPSSLPSSFPSALPSALPFAPLSSLLSPLFSALPSWRPSVSESLMALLGAQPIISSVPLSTNALIAEKNHLLRKKPRHSNLSGLRSTVFYSGSPIPSRGNRIVQAAAVTESLEHSLASRFLARSVESYCSSQPGSSFSNVARLSRVSRWVANVDGVSSPRDSSEGFFSARTGISSPLWSPCLLASVASARSLRTLPSFNVSHPSARSFQFASAIRIGTLGPVARTSHARSFRRSAFGTQSRTRTGQHRNSSAPMTPRRALRGRRRAQKSRVSVQEAVEARVEQSCDHGSSSSASNCSSTTTCERYSSRSSSSSCSNNNSCVNDSSSSSSTVNSGGFTSHDMAAGLCGAIATNGGTAAAAAPGAGAVLDCDISGALNLDANFVPGADDVAQLERVLAQADVASVTESSSRAVIPDADSFNPLGLPLDVSVAPNNLDGRASSLRDESLDSLQDWVNWFEGRDSHVNFDRSESERDTWGIGKWEKWERGVPSEGSEKELFIPDALPLLREESALLDDSTCASNEFGLDSSSGMNDHMSLLEPLVLPDSLIQQQKKQQEQRQTEQCNEVAEAVEFYPLLRRLAKEEGGEERVGAEVAGELSLQEVSSVLAAKPVHSTEPAEAAHPAALRAFYWTYVFNCFGEHSWRFAGAALLALLHHSLLPVAVASFVSQLVVFIGAPLVGELMDSAPRVAAFSTISVAQLLQAQLPRQPPRQLPRQPWLLSRARLCCGKCGSWCWWWLARLRGSLGWPQEWHSSETG
ncbi:unnamed protein product [Closterium sp. NIES-54]